jgi:hypothetical protein
MDFGVSSVSTYLVLDYIVEKKYGKKAARDLVKAINLNFDKKQKIIAIFVYIMFLTLLFIIPFRIINKEEELKKIEFAKQKEAEEKKKREERALREKKEAEIKRRITEYFAVSAIIATSKYKDVTPLNEFYADTVRQFYTVKNISREKTLKLSQDFWFTFPQKGITESTPETNPDSVQIRVIERGSYAVNLYGKYKVVGIGLDSNLKIFYISDFKKP